MNKLSLTDADSFVSSKTLYLIDGSGFAYRAFYAISDLSNSKGQPTGAVFGFFNSLKKIIKDFSPKYLGVCFDVSRKTFRQDMYTEYKITRPSIPDEFRMQLPWIRDILDSLNIPVVEKKGFEADDIIATLAAKFSELGWSVVIFSFDKDILQLVEDKRIVVYNVNKRLLLDQERVLSSMKVLPKQIPDFLALTGDSVDNIPGVKGIGPKTAVSLIKEFGSLEGLFDNIDKVSKQSVKDKLSDAWEVAFMSKKLVVLDDNVDINTSPEYFKVKKPDHQKLYSIAKELEFKSVIKDFSKDSDNLSDGVQVKDYESSLAELVKGKGRLIFFLADSVGYLSLGDGTCRINLKQIKAFLEDTTIQKISFDIKDSMNRLKKHKIKVAQPYFDIMVACFLLKSHLQDFTLENLVWEHLGRVQANIDDSERVNLIKGIFEVIRQKIKQEGLESLLYNVEMPLVEVLHWMESSPVKLNLKVLKDNLSSLEKTRDKLQKEIFKDAGCSFNLNSPKQLSEILFNHLKLSPVKKTKSGFSTNEEVLIKLKSQHSIAESILEFRKASKLISTYLIPLIKLAEDSGGKVYPQFSQVGSATGRLTSFSPNFQNIPLGQINGSKIRESVVSDFDKGFILSADYSQIELRVLAHVSGDENFIEAFRKDKDIHKFTASLLFAKPEDKISFSERTFAKRINFGIVYGMSPYGLAKELDISQKEAARFIEEYFRRYQKVKEYIDHTTVTVIKEGFVETCFGRRRYLDNVNSSNKFLKEYALRQAVNAPIQGTAADIIKMAMVKVFCKFNEEKIKSRLIMQIHDELVFDVCKEELERISASVKNIMEGIVSFKVPLKVNINYGKTWLDASKS